MKAVFGHFVAHTLKPPDVLRVIAIPTELDAPYNQTFVQASAPLAAGRSIT